MKVREGIVSSLNSTSPLKEGLPDGSVTESGLDREAMLIKILHSVQERLGYIPVWAQKTISRELNIPLSRIHGVVSFYSYFSQEPKGRHTIQLCQGTACYVRGGKKIRKQINTVLGIDKGQTTEDSRFSLEVVRCLGCCGLAPVITVDGDVYRRVNPKRVIGILDNYS